jgi:hypothetical protein
MKLSIDISIFTDSDGAYGQVMGSITVDIVPQIGDSISFLFPLVQVTERSMAFPGLLRVKDRIFNAAADSSVALSLEDVVVPTREDADVVAKLMETGFRFTVDRF